VLLLLKGEQGGRLRSLRSVFRNRHDLLAYIVEVADSDDAGDLNTGQSLTQRLMREGVMRHDPMDFNPLTQMMWALKEDGSITFEDWNAQTRHQAQALATTISCRRGASSRRVMAAWQSQVRVPPFQSRRTSSRSGTSSTSTWRRLSATSTSRMLPTRRNAKRSHGFTCSPQRRLTSARARRANCSSRRYA
jgi:hypothetical protein